MKKFLRAAVCMLLIVSMLICLAACDSKKEENQSGNSYTDALKAYEEYMNCKEFSFEKERTLFGGLADKEMKTLYEILGKSYYGESLPREWSEYVNRYNRVYGEDYTISCQIESKEKMSTRALDSYEDDLNKMGRELKNVLPNVDAADLAEYLKISTADAQRALIALASAAEILENAEVSDGYKVKVTANFSGSKKTENDAGLHPRYQLDRFLKINGRWVGNIVLRLAENQYWELSFKFLRYAS